MTAAEFEQAIYDTAAQAGVKVEKDGASYKLTSNLYGAKGQINLEASATLTGVFTGGTPTEDGTIAKKTAGEDAVIEGFTVPDENAKDKIGFTNDAIWSSDGNRVKIIDNNGFSMDFLIKDDFDVTQELEIEVTDIGKMTIQIGSNELQTMDVRIPEISSNSLYLDTVDVTVAGGADRAISTLDDAIEKLSSVRSKLGSFQNRLEYADSSLAATHEDMTAAYSRLLDTDMASEMTEYAQLNILNQATVSVLSQANDMPQQILSLLS